MGDFEIEVFIEREQAGFSLVREFDIGDEINSDSRMHMLDSCSRFGNLFVGRKFGFDLYKITDLEAKKESPEAVVKVSTKGQLQWLAVSSCGLTLLASTITDGKTDNTFYDVRSLMKGSRGYFAKQSPATSPSNGALLSAAWNPSISEIITMIYSSGAVEVLKVEDTVAIHASRPPMKAKCVAWSPKGKQMVIGFGDGSLAQFTPTMEIKKKVNACPLINGQAKITDIVWISTYKFGVAYADDTSDAGANLFTVHLPEKGEKRDPLWRCFEDPTFAAAAKRDSQMYLPLIVPWGMFAVTNSNSGDCALMGTKNTEVQVWSLPDEARAELPLNEDSDETSCVIGACWNMNFKEPLKILTHQQNAPCLWVLSNNGVLVAFRLYNFLPNFADQKQLTDSIPGGDRKTLAVEETVPPARVSVRQSLQRTSSVAQPNLANKSAFGNNTTLFAPALSSTPATTKIEQKTPASPKSFAFAKDPLSSSSFSLHKPAQTKPVQVKTASVVPKPSVMPTPKVPSSVFTQEDLASLVNDFESELDLYKEKNAKTDLSFFNDDSVKELKKKTDELKKFVLEAKSNSDETIDEVQHVKLRSLEAFASYEAANEASMKRTFKEENQYCKSGISELNNQ
ncbi:unnamed protein product [Oikopleura dioica]|uniref:Nucleoporin Nup159/Nup146 N-terminal domain-containing protein n=1 Tax=Oikopleura dioica TaxID=34765 RepID=E4XKV1_OIKDI|nr:unnamed protein product [Oikopleura dioica]